ncbi:MAG TPA: hypothetical protein VEF71_19645 [Streptosporangiaceae bacterium]|nr:hypothetical protein [Streptosporangiaceae bacterium]
MARVGPVLDRDLAGREVGQVRGERVYRCRSNRHSTVAVRCLRLAKVRDVARLDARDELLPDPNGAAQEVDALDLQSEDLGRT